MQRRDAADQGRHHTWPSFGVLARRALTTLTACGKNNEALDKARASATVADWDNSIKPFVDCLHILAPSSFKAAAAPQSGVGRNGGTVRMISLYQEAIEFNQNQGEAADKPEFIFSDTRLSAGER